MCSREAKVFQKFCFCLNALGHARKYIAPIHLGYFIRYVSQLVPMSVGRICFFLSRCCHFLIPQLIILKYLQKVFNSENAKKNYNSGFLAFPDSESFTFPHTKKKLYQAMILIGLDLPECQPLTILTNLTIQIYS